MTTIVTRAGKGSPLTNNEVDTNFTNLNDAKIETLTSTDSSVTITGTGSSRNLSVPVNPNSVSGPASSTDNAVVRFDGTTGKLIQNSTAATIDDSGNADFLSQKADFFDIDTAATTSAAVGRLRWDASKGTAVLGEVGGNLEIAVGQTLDALVTNAESVTINKGQVVYLFSAAGNRASVKLAYNTGDATSAKTFGVAAEDIAANGIGLVRCVGVLDGLNLGSYTAGDTLYLGATAGSLTATKPYAPNHLVYVGLVERANNGNGQLYVRVQNGYELDEIHDVQINNGTLANGQTILYDAATSLWKNANLTAGTGVSITNGASSVTITNSGVTQATAGTGISVSAGTGNVTITNTGVTSVTGTSPVASSGGATPAISLASGYGDTQNPYASKTANNFLAAPNGIAGVPTFRAIVAADIPTLNQNTTGTASNVTGTVAIANGGTGATTRQDAMDALAGAVTSGQYLRGNGTDVVMSAIQAGDVPTLNQNTTGTASNVTGIVAVANGGTGLSSTPTNGQLDIGNGTGFTRAALTAGTGISVTNGAGSISIANSGVTSIAAGSGISVSASTGGVTITNTSTGPSISNDTTTNATYYPVWATATTGSFSTAGVSSTKFTFNPSTGTASATVFSATSDERLKDEITIITDALAKIKQLRGINYKWKDSGLAGTGLSAQDVQRVVPEAVVIAPNGDLSVAYGNLLGLLVEGMKDLAAQVEELKLKVGK